MFVYLYLFYYRALVKRRGVLSMKKYLVICAVLLLLGLFSAGKVLGWGRTIVHVTGQAFTPNRVEVTEGGSVDFQNQTGHGGVVLCLGQRGVCGPPASDTVVWQKGGVTLAVNETLPVAFNYAGMYSITSPQHASMTLVVTVDKSSVGNYGNGGGGSSGTGSGGGDDSSGGSGGGGGSGE